MTTLDFRFKLSKYRQKSHILNVSSEYIDFNSFIYQNHITLYHIWTSVNVIQATVPQLISVKCGYYNKKKPNVALTLLINIKQTYGISIMSS